MYIPESYFSQIIAHCDINYCYAQIELVEHPQLRGKPMAVLGSKEDRSGIVLAATPEAKARGVKTGMVYWEAQQHCRDILFQPAHFKLYQQYSSYIFKDVYAKFTDRVEPFGLDEGWLDLTGTAHLFGGGLAAAKAIKEKIWRETGLTISVGMSHNKVLAKLGSDYKKPDGLTVFGRDDWRSKVFPLPVGELLYIGRKTAAKMNWIGIYTIGDLASWPEKNLVERFGKLGTMYYMQANGIDQTPVHLDAAPIKTIGNSQTAPYDMRTDEEVLALAIVLAESVTMRLREAGFLGRGVEMYLRDNTLQGKGRQCHLKQPSNLCGDILGGFMELYHRHKWGAPLRSIGVRAIDLIPDDTPYQVSFDCDADKQAELQRLANATDDVRRRFGNKALRRAREMEYPALTGFDVKRDNTVHPVGYLRKA